MRDNSNKSRPLAGILKDFIAPHKLWLVLRITGAVIGAAVDIVLAYVIVQIVDAAISSDHNSIKRGLIVLAGAVTAGFLSSLINRYSSGRLGAQTVKTIRSTVASHTPELKVSWMACTPVKSYPE